MDDWECCWYHPPLRLVLMVYVDDLEMSGPESNLAEGWKKIQKHLVLDLPTSWGAYLGCDHVEVEVDREDPFWKNIFTASAQHILLKAGE